MRSMLLFFMYSYTSNLCGPSEQHPRSRTKFFCWMLVIIFTSERNSDSPCWDLSRDNFFTATSLPSCNFPYETRGWIIKVASTRTWTKVLLMKFRLWHWLARKDILVNKLYPIDRPESTSSKKISRMKILSCFLQCLKVEIVYCLQIATPEIVGFCN